MGDYTLYFLVLYPPELLSDFGGGASLGSDECVKFSS